jgi:hypothetical protein
VRERTLRTALEFVFRENRSVGMEVVEDRAGEEELLKKSC